MLVAMGRPKGKPQPDMTTVRLTIDIHRQAKGILEALSRHGWASFGIDRSDPPTMLAVVEEAIRSLAARHKVKGGK
jgi:hypothetical protein